MKTEQRMYTKEGGWRTVFSQENLDGAQVVFAFGETSLLKDSTLIEEIKKNYPAARVVGCSTAGEIAGTIVRDDSIVTTAIKFEKANLEFVKANIEKMYDSFIIGSNLAKQLKSEGLVHVLVFSEGLNINGSDLVRGITSQLPAGVALTGGLSGDKDRFKETVVLLDAPGTSNTIVLVGLYGEIKVGYGSMGGWDTFGIDRVITKSHGNVLYELDNQPALDLYKKYLGEQATGLPATGLLFPLSIKTKNNEQLVRTILSVDESAKSMTFAGDVPEGSYARLMKANFERLIDGAADAASMTHEKLGQTKPELALLISCVGRKLVLKQRVEEEIESVKEKLGTQATLMGFYSYGEICPTTPTSQQCELHNQTMTITTFTEF